MGGGLPDYGSPDEGEARYLGDLARRARHREDATRADLARRKDDPGRAATPGPHKTVAVGTYPTATGSVFAVVPIYMKGVEREGDAVDYDEGTTSVRAGHIGGVVPPEGTVVIVFRQDGHGMFTYNG